VKFRRGDRVELRDFGELITGTVVAVPGDIDTWLRDDDIDIGIEHVTEDSVLIRPDAPFKFNHQRFEDTGLHCALSWNVKFLSREFLPDRLFED